MKNWALLLTPTRSPNVAIYIEYHRPRRRALVPRLAAVTLLGSTMIAFGVFLSGFVMS